MSYGGQVFRHVLVGSLKDRMGGMTDRITGGWTPAVGEVTGELDRYFRYTDTWATNDHGLSTTPAPDQTTLGDFGSTKDLKGKIAGEDADGQHVDWNTAGVVGWGSGLSPLALVDDWFATVDALAQSWVDGTPPQVDGTDVSKVFLDDQGRDYQQLIQKFLLGAVGFSQAADDYLDDDFPGKGLLSDHTARVDGKPYTALEHSWDEAWGYFGAARDYAAYSDDDIKNGVNIDTDNSGGIDISREMNQGHSVNAGKRDRLAAANMDLTADAWTGFTEGRALLAATAGSALTVEQQAELTGYRDMAIGAWEKAIAATVVHYINDVLQDMNAAEYVYANHAKHWGELKGFALSLQFNRTSKVSDADFGTLQTLIGEGPALPGDAGFDAYKDDLRSARTILGTSYEFPAEAMGDDDGEGGF